MSDHDAGLCRCLEDDEIVHRIRTQGIHDKLALVPARCQCTCSKCLARKISYDGYIRRGKLERRLTKAGFDMQDFADLVWMHVSDRMEAWVKAKVREGMQEVLRTMRLKSVVSIMPENVYGVESKPNGKESHP